MYILRCTKSVKNFGVLSRHVVLSQKNDVLQCACNFDNLIVPLIKRSKTMLTKEKARVYQLLGKIKTLENLIKIHGRIQKQQIQIILQKLHYTESIDNRSGYFLLHACGQVIGDCKPSQRMEMVECLKDYLEQHCVSLNVTYYNILITVYMENDHDFSPMKILSEMKEKDIRPNEITFEKLIQHSCRKGNMSEARELMDQMHRHGFNPSDEIYNSVLEGYSNNGNIKKISQILNVMEHKGVELSASIYTTLMCTHAKKNDIKAIIEILKMCRRKYVKIYNEHILRVIYELIQNNHMEHVDMMFSMLSSCDYPRSEIFFPMDLVSIGKMELALKYYIEIISWVRDKSWLKSKTEIFLSKILEKEVDFNDLIQICKTLQSKEAHPDPMLMALYYSLNNKCTQLTPKLIVYMKEDGYSIKPHYFWPLIISKAEAFDTDSIFNILRWMKNMCNVEVDICTLKYCVLPYTFGTMSRIRKQLFRCNIAKTVVHNAFVFSLLNHNKIKKALDYMLNYSTIYWNVELKAPLVSSLCYTNDVVSYVAICQRLYEKKQNDLRNHNTITDEDSLSLTSMDDHLLYLLETAGNRYIVLNVVREIINSQIALEEETIKIVTSYLDDYLEPEMQEQLGKISHDHSIEQISSYVQYIYQLYDTMLLSNTNDMPSDDMKFKLAKLILNEQNKGSIAPKMHMHLIQHFAKINLMTKRLNEFPQIHEEGSAIRYFALKNGKLLLQIGDISNLCTLLKKCNGNSATEMLNKLSLNLLNIAVYTRSRNNFSKLYTVLIQNNYLCNTVDTISTVIMQCLQMSHYSLATKLFCSHIKTKPALIKKSHVLMRNLINDNRYDLLKYVTASCMYVLGESVVLVDLVFLYVQCNKLSAAIAVLRRLRVSITSESLDRMARHLTNYIANQDITEMEKVYKISHHFPKTIRDLVYVNLVQLYANQNNWKGGLSLWHNIKAHNLSIPSHFYYILAKLLTDNNQPIPFVY